MRVIGLTFVGTRTPNGAATVRFFARLMGLQVEEPEQDFWILHLPDGDSFEVYGARCPYNPHFTTGPVAGFLMEDLHAAAQELREAGAEILLEHYSDIDGDTGGWLHFRAPDGNVYELTQAPTVS